MKDSPGIERIEITNFLVLKKAEFDVKRFTVVMGEQATGKSLLAKLLYFFQSELQNFYRKLAFDEWPREHPEKIIETLKDDLKERFCKLFPVAYWENKTFSIVYTNGSISISLKKTAKRPLKIEISQVFLEIIDEWLRESKKIESDLEEKRKNASPSELERHRFLRIQERKFHVSRKMAKEYHGEFLVNNTFFVPASRSFFALLQENIFTFLANNIDIDPLMAEFGQIYAGVKRRRTVHPSLQNNAMFARMETIIQKIISGKYLYKDAKDWIIMEHGKINIANASSGQQESLPMLLSLLATAQRGNTAYFIEEPEAHLFPRSQNLVMSLLAIIYNFGGNSSFFLTTHSPYILSALDNLIMASNVATEKKKFKGEVAAIIPEECHVRYEDVGAYTLEEGKLVSVLDEESKMINADVIDDVSEEFGAEFDALMALRHGK